MIYRIGTKKEIGTVLRRVPNDVLRDLVHYVTILDSEYGEDRDYFVQGGYCMIAETEADVQNARKVLDYDTLLCEFATYIGEKKDYVSALYLPGDDFGIVLFMPSKITPMRIAQQISD